MMKTNDNNFELAAIGELLIDFTPEGYGQNGSALYARNPGGAPANVLAMFSILGGKTTFIGKVGADSFGSYLRQVLQKNHIDTSCLVEDPRYNTTLAFVHLDETGDRSFSFYRKPGADMMLSVEELNLELVRSSALLHFGSVSMTHQPCRIATLAAVDCAREAGCIISYDPNFRPLLWESREEAESLMTQGAKLADIIKVSEEELPLLTGGITAIKSGAKALLGGRASLAIISCGRDGAYFSTPSVSGWVPAYSVPVVDTTGAGDAFMGSILYLLRGKSAQEIASLDKESLKEIITFGVAAGSLATTQKGALPSLPAKGEILNCIRHRAIINSKLERWGE